MRNSLILAVEKSSLREQPLQFSVGDSVDVHTRILEGTKERIQIFSGVVIARSGTGTSAHCSAVMSHCGTPGT